MEMIEISQDVLGRRITLKASVLDEGIQILLTGGNRSHVGAVTVCEYEEGNVCCGIHYDQIIRAS